MNATKNLLKTYYLIDIQTNDFSASIFLTLFQAKTSSILKIESNGKGQAKLKFLKQFSSSWNSVKNENGINGLLIL